MRLVCVTITPQNFTKLLGNLTRLATFGVPGWRMCAANI
jgi:hypothetical protein